MKKSLINKLMAVVTVAAMIFSGIGMNPSTAYATNKIKVEGVYTNFQKATMVVGTTKQITTYTEPQNATNQMMNYKSSDKEVVTVSGTGLLEAVAPGKTTVTVTAMDGSFQTEIIKVTVLNDLVITSKDVDSDNEIIIMNQTYGNVTIDESIGDAAIYFSEVTIKGTLLLEDGNYSVNVLDTTAKMVVIDEPKVNGDQIVSLSTTGENTDSPTLNIIGKSDVAAIEAKISAFIKQADGALINSISFNQEYNNKTVVYLEGFTGNLTINAGAAGDIIFVAKGCNIADVMVSGKANTGLVQFNNDGDSTIGNVSVQGAANLELNVPVTKIDIAENASGVRVSIKDSAGEVNNAGSDSQVDVQGSVDTITSSGSKAYITTGNTASITTINVNGAGSTVAGYGEIAEIYVNANSVAVNTSNSLVTIGNVTGTTVQGAAKSGGTALTSYTPPVVEQPKYVPPAVIKVGDAIVDHNFEDAKNDLISTMGSCTMVKTAGEGKDGTSGLLVRGRSANYHGVGYDFGSLVSKHITLRVKFDIKANQDGTLKATFKSNVGYNSIATVDTVAGTWYTLEGTYALDNTVTSAFLYIEHSVGSAEYTLDNIKITVDSIGDKIPVSGITLNQENVTLDIGQSTSLTATIAPATADNQNVTWSSSNTTVATIVNGVVMALSAGTTTITATTLDGAKTATCAVTVSSNVALVLNQGTVLLQSIGNSKTITANSSNVVWESQNTSIATVDHGVVTAKGFGTTTVTATLGTTTVSCNVVVSNDPFVCFDDIAIDTEYTMLGWGTNGTAKVVAEESNPANHVLEVRPANYNCAPVLNIMLPEGKTLADYKELTYKALWKQGDVGYKTILAEADVTISGAFSNTSSRMIGEVARNEGATTTYQTQTITLNDAKDSLSGNIQIALGINCKAADGGKDTIYYLDDIKLIAASGEVTGISLNRNSLSLAVGSSETLVATVEPSSANTSKAVIWSSGEEGIATVNSSGSVTAVASGTTIIYAKTTVEGISLTQYTAQCTVTVTEVPPVVPLPISYNFETPVTVGTIGATGQIVPMSDMITAVASDFATPSNQVLKVVNNNYNTIPQFEVTLPAGKALSDYTQLTARYYSVAGTDSAYKPAYLLVGEVFTYSGVSLDTCPQLMAGPVNNGFAGNGEWKTVTFNIDATKAAVVSGSAISLALGMSGPGGSTYFLDEIALVSSGGASEIVESFEGVVPGIMSAGEGSVNTTVYTKDDFIGFLLTNKSSNVLKVANSNWGQGVKLTVNLAEGTTIDDYNSITFKVYLLKSTTDAQGFGWKDFFVSVGTSITSTNGASTLNETWKTGNPSDNRGSWVTVTSTITSAIKAAVGSATTFEISFSCHTDSPASYYLDDITLVPIP